MSTRSPARTLSRPGPYPVYWVLLSAAVAGIDYALGPFIQFPIVFVVPVALAAWYSGLRWGIALSLLLPLVRLYFVSLWDVPWEFGYSLVNAGIRIGVFGGLAFLVDRLAQHERKLKEQVQQLEGLLPICSGCKKIRDEQDVWRPLELYISERTKAHFTHGFCPPCARTYFADYVEEGDPK